MKRIIYILLLLNISLMANYCIQAVTLDRFNPEDIKYKQSYILDNFENARVEKRGSYLVLRVGDFTSYSDSLNDIADVQKIYSDAYIRKCDLDFSKVIYPVEDKSSMKRVSYIRENRPKKVYPPKRNIQRKRVKIAQKKYEQPEPQDVYYTDTLWQDCQKCFAPIYLEEEESEPQTHTIQKVKKVAKENKTKRVVRRKYKTTLKTDDDFWIEAVDDEKESLDEKPEDFYNPKYYPQIDNY